MRRLQPAQPHSAKVSPLSHGPRDLALAAGLRTSSSDPHLVGLLQPSYSDMVGDPMISMCDRDLNSPIMFMQTDSLYDSGLCMEDINRRESVAMETGRT